MFGTVTFLLDLVENSVRNGLGTRNVQEKIGTEHDLKKNTKSQVHKKLFPTSQFQFNSKNQIKIRKPHSNNY